MTQNYENIRTRIESSFLFTREERESLMLLCVHPELAEIVAECLLPAFESEEAAATALSQSVNRESLAVAREIEAAETRAEEIENHPIFA